MASTGPASWTFLTAAVAFLTSAATAAGQVSTGGIRGVVRDETGAVIPGVAVEAGSPSRIGRPLADVSNDQGLYRFEWLPVGLYTLTFSRPGFKMARVDDVRVEVGRSIDHDVVLTVGPVSETLTVVAQRPVVDAAHAGASTVFNQQLIENVPSTRFSYFDTITFAPAVKTDQSVNVAVFNVLGSNADQNSFQYHGVDVSAPSFGSPWDFPNFDIIQEIEVRTMGASAEYYGVQGGVINVITKSGSNQWRRTGSYFLMDGRLVGNNTPAEHFPFNIDYQHDFSLQIGGPIVTDRLWVNGILQIFRSRASDVGVDPRLAPAQHKYRPFFKVNATASSRDTLEFLVNDNNFWTPNQPSRTAPPETVLVEHGHNPVVVARWLRALGPSTLFELKGGGIYIRDRLDPYSGDLRTPGRFDYGDGTSKANAGYTWRDAENKTSLDASIARNVSQWLGGSHDFKAGVQYTASSTTINDAYLQNVFYYDLGGPYLAERHEPSGTGGRVRLIGGFSQDDWAVHDRLTLNLGVRADRTTAGIQAIDQFDDSSTQLTGVRFAAVPDLVTFGHVSPRLGAAVRLDKSARTVAKASYGRYHGKLNTNMFSAVSPGNTSFDGFAFNASTGRYDVPTYSIGSGQVVRVDPNLANQYTDQVFAGIERQLGPDFGVDLSFVHKRESNFIRQRDAGGVYAPVPLVDPFGGTTRTLTVFNLTPASKSEYLITNRRDLTQSYNALILQAYKRWSDGWQLHGSYVWQRALGYASGVLGVQSQDFSSFGSSRNFGRDPNDLINAYGRLPTDSTHGVKVSATYQAPHGIQLALRYSLESGRPYGRIVDALDLHQGVRQVVAEPRGTYSLPAVNDLQVRIDKDFPLRGSRRVRVSVDVYNLFNSDTALTVRNNSSEAGSDFGQALSVAPPRRAMLGIRVEF